MSYLPLNAGSALIYRPVIALQPILRSKRASPRVEQHLKNAIIDVMSKRGLLKISLDTIEGMYSKRKVRGAAGRRILVFNRTLPTLKFLWRRKTRLSLIPHGLFKVILLLHFSVFSAPFGSIYGS